MGPLLEPTPFNNLARGGLAGAAFAGYGLYVLSRSKGDPRLLFFGGSFLMLGCMFLSALLKALRR